MANSYGLGFGYDIDLFNQALENATMDTGQKIRKAAGYNPYGPGRINQANQGGNNGTVNGASTTKSAVNSGTGVQEISKSTLGEVPSVDEITNTARGKTTYTPRFDRPADQLNDTVTTLSGDRLPLGVVNENRDMNSRSGSTTVGEGDNTNLLGKNPNMTRDQFLRESEQARLANRNTSLGNDFNESNVNPRPSGGGAFSTYTPPDYEGAISALRDLREAKIEAAGGRGNRDTGPPYEEAQSQSYSQDLADYNSGDLRSEGYSRIRNERMDLQDQIDEATRGLPKGLKSKVSQDIYNRYSDEQKARLGLEAEQSRSNSERYKANMANLSDQTKLRLAQNKELFDQFNANRQFDLSQNQFGLDTEKAADERQYKANQTRLGESRLGLDQQDYERRAFDTKSQSEARGWNTEIDKSKAQMDAARLGMEPGKVIDTIMQTENGVAKYAPSVRIQRLRVAGYTDDMIKLIDPEGYKAVQQ